MDEGHTAAIVDIDGTLVDSNYQHAIAWHRAFRAHGITVELRRIHRHIGMGGDQLVRALAGEEAEEAHGESLRAAEKEKAELRAELDTFRQAEEERKKLLWSG